MAYQEEPNSIVWCVRTDGQLLGFTYQREQQVTAWHRHIFGGSFGSGNAVCESVEVLPTDDSEYQVWVIIKRTINGVTKRYVEYLHKFDFDETDDTSFNYLDSQLAYDGSATTTISGLDHLEGETVSVLADGSTHPNKVVSSGGITLDRSSTKVKVTTPPLQLHCRIGNIFLSENGGVSTSDMYITTISSATFATTPRSCVIIRTAICNSDCRSLSSFRICA